MGRDILLCVFNRLWNFKIKILYKIKTWMVYPYLKDIMDKSCVFENKKLEFLRRRD